MSMWEELPKDVLENIAERLTVHSDLFTFRLTCQSWQSVALENYTRLPYNLPMSFCVPRQCPPPLLMLPSKDGSEYNDFFSICKEKFVGAVDLPETRGKWLCASTKGWLLMMDFVENPEELELFNPLTHDKITLPPLSSFPLPHCMMNLDQLRTPLFIQKAVLSSDPLSNPDGWILMVIACTQSRLCFIRAGEKKWTVIGHASDIQKLGPEEHIMDDVIYHRGNFYVVNLPGFMSVCDIDSIPPKLTVISRRIDSDFCSDKKYLVVTSQGRLLLVAREGVPVTEFFCVFQLDEKSRGWTELETLGHDSLFLGRNESVAFSAHIFPKLKENCIYFTDDYFLLGIDYTKKKLYSDSGMFVMGTEDDTQYDNLNVDDDVDYPNASDGVFKGACIQKFAAVDSHTGIPPLWLIPSRW